MKKILTLLAVLLMIGSMMTVKATTYTVAGSSPEIFGTTWDPTNTANDMTLANGLYVFAKKGNFSQTPIEFKVCEDHSFSICYPGSNYEYTIPDGSKYLIITYNPDGNAVNAFAISSMTVAGSNATLFGDTWNPANTANDMVLQDNGTYKFERTGVALSAGTIELKACANHAWTNAWPGDNYTLSIPSNGNYTVTITFDPATLSVSVSADLEQASEVIPAIQLHSNIKNPSWETSAEFDVAGNETTASLTLTGVTAGNYSFKLLVGGDWRSNGYTYHRDFTGAAGIIDNGDDMTLEADVDGDYTFTWTYGTNELSIGFPDEGDIEYVTVKFFAPRTQDNPWNNVYAFSWKGSRTFTDAFPGEEITNSKDGVWYTYNVRKGANVIFSDNNGMQTVNIEDLQEDVCLVSTDIDKVADPKLVTVSVAEQCTVDYYIAGSQTLIGGTDDFDTNLLLDENNQILFQDVMPGTYSFKINNGTWAWALGGNDHLKDGDCQTIAQTVGLGDVGFKIDTKQDVTITYYPETQEICLGAVTVKADGEVNADDMEIKAGASKKIEYATNNTESPAATYVVLSGSEYIALFKGAITGIKAGTATVRVTLAESANYTEASDEFTVTVSNPTAPATAIETVGGKFIINANRDTVVFSRGNLTYNVATEQWYCANKQYDFVGENGNLHFGDDNYTGEFDLFGWSCTASNYGLLQSNYDEVYTGEFVDWGGLFSGGAQEWTSLTGSEMTYIVNHHQWTILVLDPTPADADNNDEIYGLALFPLNWVMPEGFDNLHYSLCDWNEEAKFADNTIPLSDWSTLEAAGAVFLPMAGARAGHWGNTWNGKAEDSRRNPNPNGGNSYCWVDNIGWYGYYWSSTTDPRTNHPYDAQYLIFPGWSEGPTLADEDDLYLPPVVWSREKRRGNSVRLVTRRPRQEVVIRDGLTDGKWGTLCPSRNVEFVNGAAFYQIAYLEERDGMPFNMVFDEIEGTSLTAGQPYFFIASADAIKGTKVGAELTAAGAGVNGFYGYIGDASWELPFVADYDAAEDNTYVIYNNSVFRINQGGTMLKSERCYIIISATQPTRASVPQNAARRRLKMSVQNAETATGEENGVWMKADNGVQKVLLDGQLLILRGNQLFDATGRMIK